MLLMLSWKRSAGFILRSPATGSSALALLTLPVLWGCPVHRRKLSIPLLCPLDASSVPTSVTANSVIRHCHLLLVADSHILHKTSCCCFLYFKNTSVIPTTHWALGWDWWNDNECPLSLQSCQSQITDGDIEVTVSGSLKEQEQGGEQMNKPGDLE